MNRWIVKLLWIGPALSLAVMVSCEGSYFRKKMEEKSAEKKVEAPVPPPPAPPPPPPVAVAPASPAPVPPAQPGQSPLPQAPGLAPAAVEADPSEEVNAYIECLNRTLPRTTQSYERYLSWVNANTGPTCKETHISYNLYELYPDGVKKCQDAASKGAAIPPALPNLEKAAADLASAYAELVPIVQTVHDYYEQQDYKDDACAKGKELHPKLMAAFDRYRNAHGRMQVDMKGLKEKIDQKELEHLEREQGKKLAWHTRNYTIQARKLMDTIPPDDKAKFDVPGYLSAYPTVEAAYQGFSTYYQANPAETQGVFWFSAYENTAKGFFTKAKFLKRDLAEGKAAEKRAVNDLISEYNRFISDSNNLKF